MRSASTPWLDPELEAALAGVPWRERTQAVIDPDDLAVARARLASYVEPEDGRPIHSENVLLDRPEGGQLMLRVHRPDRAPEGDLAVLVWLHGGGYLLGSAATDTRAERAYADRVGCCVVGVDYRVAPKHPHPAALHDVLRALAWVRRTPGLNAARVAIGGESAGAGLAAATALADHGLCFQLLVAPMLDDCTDDAVDPEVSCLGLWDGRLNKRAWELYLGGTESGSPVAAAARADSLSGLPPACLDVGTADLFCGETVSYAERLRRNGIPTELHVWPGAYHGFYELAPQAQLSVLAIETRTLALRRALA